MKRSEKPVRKRFDELENKNKDNDLEFMHASHGTERERKKEENK